MFWWLKLCGPCHLYVRKHMMNLLVELRSWCRRECFPETVLSCQIGIGTRFWGRVLCQPGILLKPLPPISSSPDLRPMAVCMNVSFENCCCINYLTEFWHQAFYAPSFSKESFLCHLSTIALFVGFCGKTGNMDGTDLKILAALHWN